MSSSLVLEPDRRPATTLLRRLLLALFFLGAAGTGAELVLLGHYEEIWQLVPLVLIALSLIVGAFWCVVGEARILRLFQLMMAACVVAGVVGVILHYRSNIEFELEISPSKGGTDLIWSALTGAMPALAPGAMLHLGLLGLVYAFRHPVLSHSGPRESSREHDDEQ